jgi:Spy/CpxP family protein refolding chaperone
MQSRFCRWAAFAAAVALAPCALAAPPAQGQAGAAATAPHMAHKRMGQHGGHWRDGGYDMRALDQLDLTAAQRTNIRQLMQQDRAAARPEREALMTKRQAFAKATPGTNDYSTATSALAKAEAQAAEADETRRAHLRGKIYGELAPAQRTMRASLQAQRQQRMQKWRDSHPKSMRHHTPSAASSAAAR